MGNSQPVFKQPEKTKNYVFAKERSIFDVTDDEINSKYMSSKSESEIAARAAKDSENRLREFQAKLRGNVENRDSTEDEKEINLPSNSNNNNNNNNNIENKNIIDSSEVDHTLSDTEEIYQGVVKEVLGATKRTRKKLSESKSPRDRGRSQSSSSISSRSRGISKVVPLNLESIQQE